MHNNARAYICDVLCCCWSLQVLAQLEKSGEKDWFCWKSDGEGPLVAFFEELVHEIVPDGERQTAKRFVVCPMRLCIYFLG